MGQLPNDIQTKSRKKLFSIFLHFIFKRLIIIRSSRQKYGQNGNFKAFQKMGLLPIDIQTQSQKKIIFDFSIFFFIFSNRLNITHDQADKNMDRQGILRHFRKWAYFPSISKPRDEKNYFDVRYFSLFFLIDLILSNQADKNMDRQGILKPFRKWAQFPPISKPCDEKQKFIFFHIFLFQFLNT